MKNKDSYTPEEMKEIFENYQKGMELLNSKNSEEIIKSLSYLTKLPYNIRITFSIDPYLENGLVNRLAEEMNIKLDK